MATAFADVRVDKLVKLYGRTRAPAGSVRLTPASAVTAVEGPNGSGKSTLLHCLALLAKPTSGQIAYGKLDGRKHARQVRRYLGVLTHASMLYPDLTGRENLRFYAELCAAPPPRVDELCARFELGRFVDRAVRTYSRGQLQRVALARALVGEPSLLLLDEPSTGLDAKGVRQLVEVVRAERERGVVVVLVTHDQELSAQVADRRVRLRRGKLVGEAGEALEGARP